MKWEKRSPKALAKQRIDEFRDRNRLPKAEPVLRFAGFKPTPEQRAADLARSEYDAHIRGLKERETQAPGGSLYRARVPGGWLVRFDESWSGRDAGAGMGGATFIPDPTWSWDWTKDEP